LNRLDSVNALEQALMDFRTVNNRLPCPADATVATSDPNYGIEASNGDTCTGGTPAANLTDSSKRVVASAVPFKTLDLPEGFMYDGWDREFAYAVDQRLTALRAMQHMEETPAQQCGATVRDVAASNRSTGAAYTLLS
jgi:hypothetical protein